MKSFNRFVVHFRTYGLKHKLLLSASWMLLFWSIFDGIVSYISPLIITRQGFSNTLMGIIIGTSSVAGAFFDFLLCKYLQSSHWRRLYFFLFAVCFIFPLILWQAKTVYLFLIAMSLWGLYYDLMNFGNFDFVSRQMPKDQHAASFGILGVFKSLGYLLAPLIVGVVIAESINWQPFVLAWIFLALAFIFFLILYLQGNQSGVVHIRELTYRPKGFLVEMQLWKKIGKILSPFLFLSLLISLHDSFFWTIGPLLSETFTAFKPLDGLFLTVFSLPPLLVGWFVGKFKHSFGKTANFKSFMISSLFLILFAFFRHPLLLLIVIFVSSVFATFAWAIGQGMYADFIDSSLPLEKEIEGLVDFSINLGYVVGPILAGVLSDKIGYFNTFAVLGIFGFILTFIFSRKVPDKVPVLR